MHKKSPPSLDAPAGYGLLFYIIIALYIPSSARRKASNMMMIM